MPTINNPYVNPVDLNNTAPKVHASQHRQGGSDPLTPADIGAAAENHTHEVSGLTVAWEEVTNKPAMFPAVQHAATHGSGGSDPLAIDASQITTGTVPLARLPHGCMERLVIVQDDTARYALTTADVQQGDTVKVVETSTMYFVVDETKLDSPDGYVAYTAGAASAVDWSAITGKPDTFPAAAPSWGSITGRPSMLGFVPSSLNQFSYSHGSGNPVTYLPSYLFSNEVVTLTASVINDLKIYGVPFFGNSSERVLVASKTGSGSQTIQVPGGYCGFSVNCNTGNSGTGTLKITSGTFYTVGVI